MILRYAEHFNKPLLGLIERTSGDTLVFSVSSSLSCVDHSSEMRFQVGRCWAVPRYALDGTSLQDQQQREGARLYTLEDFSRSTTNCLRLSSLSVELLRGQGGLPHCHVSFSALKEAPNAPSENSLRMLTRAGLSAHLLWLCEGASKETCASSVRWVGRPSW